LDKTELHGVLGQNVDGQQRDGCRIYCHFTALSLQTL
jgi:hypothetical protein